MLEKFKQKWKRYISNRYAIKRNGIISWFIYGQEEQSVRKAAGPSELLIAMPFGQEPIFEESIVRPKWLRGFIAHYYLQKFRKKYAGRYNFELIEEKALLFVTDITGISGN